MTFLRPALVLAAFALSCGGSTDDGSGSAGTGGIGTGGAGAGGAGTGGTGTGGAGTGGTGTGGASGSGGGVGGSAGSSNTCVSDADCGQGICGYAVSAGCSAVGQCFPTPGAICDAYSPACACDGTVVSVICEGLPDGYAKKPVEHLGACSSGGTFACGPNLTCDSSSQYCEIGVGGPAGAEPTYSCRTTPVGCQNDYSCACIQKAVGAQDCSLTGDGVSVTFYYP